LGTDLSARPFYILCFAEMCLAGVLAYETLRVDAMALGAFAHLIALRCRSGTDQARLRSLFCRAG
jgi:hypothetical protein